MLTGQLEIGIYCIMYHERLIVIRILICFLDKLQLMVLNNKKNFIDTIIANVILTIFSTVFTRASINISKGKFKNLIECSW